jgi:hypothetical protein
MVRLAEIIESEEGGRRADDLYEEVRAILFSKNRFEKMQIRQ